MGEDCALDPEFLSRNFWRTGKWFAHTVVVRQPAASQPRPFATGTHTPWCLVRTKFSYLGPSTWYATQWWDTLSELASHRARAVRTIV